MNNVGKATFAILMAVFGLSSWATDYTWTGNGQENNWADRNNYDPVPAEGVLPGAEDIIKIPEGVTVKLAASDTDSWAVANALKRIRPMGGYKTPMSTIEITVNENDGTDGVASLDCQINYNYSSSWYHGCVVKKGKGVLRTLSTAQNGYYVTWDVREGDVVFPQEIGEFSTTFDSVIVAEGARVFTPSGIGGSLPYPPVFRGISGLGMITNSSSSGKAQKLLVNSLASSFDGVIGGSIELTAGIELQLNNLGNTFSGGAVSSGADIKIPAFGMTGEPSPLGTSANLTIAKGGFGFVYLGEGETTDKNLLLTASTGLSTLDAGATGGLTWTGDITPSGKVKPSLLLTGDGSKTNVVEGAICVSSSGSAYSITNLVKRGAGTWRIADNANDTWSGMLTVEEGTLQFDSMAPVGTVSALGTAALATPYSVWLKGGTLEYTGTDDADGLRRTVGVSADATILNSSDAELTLGNVSAAADDVTLTLGGGDMILSGVTGDLSIRKTGAGTVKLIGDQTFEGELAVTEGTAIVDLPKYEWYRFDFKHTASNETIFMVGTIGLYDEDGHCHSLGLDVVSSTSFADIAPGTAWQNGSRYSSNTASPYGPFKSMFEDDTSYWAQYLSSPTRSLNEDSEDNWATAVVRLPRDAGPIVSYDLVLMGTEHSNGKKRSCSVHSLQASVDGNTWDDVGGTNTYEQLKCNYQWLYGHSEYVAGDAAVHTTGCPIPARPAQRPAQLNNCTVNVSKDAALKAGAEGMTISKLRFDAAGVGTIEGFSLADEGTIDFANVAKGTRSLTFTIPGMDAAETDKIADWTFTVNGETPKNWSVSVRNGVVTLQKNGLILLVR